MNLLAFAGSNSKKSINKKLVTYVANTYWSEANVEVLDLNDYAMPVFGVDLQDEKGIPQAAFNLAEKIDWADLLVISLAEHNGAYTAAFKNTFDWLSRMPDRTVFMDKPLLLLSTSPGARGASSVLKIAETRFPFNGGKVLATFSLPSFGKNFDSEKGITDDNLRAKLESTIEEVKRQAA